MKDKNAKNERRELQLVAQHLDKAIVLLAGLPERSANPQWLEKLAAILDEIEAPKEAPKKESQTDRTGDEETDECQEGTHAQQPGSASVDEPLLLAFVDRELALPHEVVFGLQNQLHSLWESCVSDQEREDLAELLMLELSSWKEQLGWQP